MLQSFLLSRPFKKLNPLSPLVVLWHRTRHFLKEFHSSEHPTSGVATNNFRLSLNQSNGRNTVKRYERD